MVKTSRRSAPVASGEVVISNRPSFRASKNGFIVKHAEYLGDLSGISGSNVVITYPLTPGNPTVFPWLSRIASNFQKSRFTGLRVMYRSECATTVNGVVILAYERDVSATTRNSKLSLLEIENSISTSPWMSCSNSMRPDNREIMINYGSVAPQNTDFGKYSIGNLIVGAFGTPTSVLGEIWLEYEVELMNACLEVLPDVNLYMNFTCYDGGSVFPTTVAALNWDGNVTVNSTTLGTGAANRGQFNLSLPPGGYIYTQYLSSSSALGAVVASVTGGTIAHQTYSSGAASSMLVVSFSIESSTSTTISIAFPNATLSTGTTNLGYLASFDSQQFG